jgi:hypothetical protein
MKRTSSLVFGLALLACASVSGAQVLQPPPRPVRGLFGGGRPPDPNRARQELTVTANLLGGYDDNLVPSSGGGDTLAPHPSGYIGFADAQLRYFFGRTARSLEAVGRGYMNTYRNVGLTPSYGGDLSLRAGTDLGRRSRLQMTGSVRYDPFFSLGIFGGLEDVEDVETPDANPTNALTESRSWSSDASALLHHGWSRRTRSSIGYSFRNRTYVEGGGFDSRTQAGSVGLERSLGRRTSLRAQYRYSDGEHEQQNGAVRPLVTQTIDLGLSYLRPLSRTRHLTISGGGGSQYVDTISGATGANLRYWAPSGHGSVRLDIGPSWSVAGDYRRAVSVLEGISPEPFVSHAGTLSVGGFIGSRLESVLTASYSNGRSGYGSETEEPGDYDGYTGTAQFRIRLTRWWSTLVSVTHYQYRLSDAASESLGVPSEMHRNAVRLGFTWTLPLYGAYIDRAQGGRGGRD